MGRPIKVAVVDQHPLYRVGVEAALRDDDDFEVVAAGGADLGLDLSELGADVVLIDWSVAKSCPLLVADLEVEFPTLKLIVISDMEEKLTVGEAWAAGVSAYVCKGVDADELRRIIAAVSKGARYVSPSIGARLLS